MKKRLRYLLFFVFIIIDISSSWAQSVQRQTTSSSGSIILSDGTLIRQTIGQPYNTTTNYNNGISYRPGFQQPVISIELLKSDLKLTIFPNPTSDFINIETLEIIDNVTLSVVDNLGKLLLNSTFEHFNKYQLNCSNYSNGIYIINITAENKNASAKLIINH